MAVEGQVAASTQNQALSALLFLYREVLERDFGWLGNGGGVGVLPHAWERDRHVMNKSGWAVRSPRDTLDETRIHLA